MNFAKTESGLRGSALIGMLFIISTVLPAQSIWLDRSAKKSVALEFLKPNFDEDMGIKSAYALFASLRLPISPSVSLAVELPISHTIYKEYDYNWDAYYYTDFIRIHEESETAIGNPYIGFEIPNGKDVFWEMGLRLPMASKEKYYAEAVGIFSDLDRAEAFGSKVLPFHLSFNYCHRQASGFAIRLRGGPDLWINTDSEPGSDKTELYLHYSAQLGYENAQFCFLAGITGKWWVTGEDMDFGERTFHQLGFEAGLKFGRIHPGIHLRLPLDEDLSDILDSVIGLNCSYQFE
jgi:hypothetical protein